MPFSQFTRIYALNAVWGRFDQTLGNINTLYSMQGETEDVQLFLVTEDSIIFLLKPVSTSDTDRLASTKYFWFSVYLLTSFVGKERGWEKRRKRMREKRIKVLLVPL